MNAAHRYAALFRVELAWLLYGEGPMKPDDVQREAARIARELTPEDRAAWFKSARLLLAGRNRESVKRSVFGQTRAQFLTPTNSDKLSRRRRS